MKIADNVEYLPVWKFGATAEERFLELAMIAKKNPERFAKVAVIYEGAADANKLTRLRYTSCGVINNNELVGIIDIAKHDIIEDMKR